MCSFLLALAFVSSSYSSTSGGRIFSLDLSGAIISDILDGKNTQQLSTGMDLMHVCSRTGHTDTALNLELGVHDICLPLQDRI